MDALELARWTRFAAKGGIGKCTAIQDCVAESNEDLMFLKDDDITVLMQIPDSDGIYLGFCEGVVGKFSGETVHFHSKLKRPIMTKRNSAISSRVKSPAAASPSPTTGSVHRNSSNSTPMSSDPNTPLTPSFSAVPSLEAKVASRSSPIATGPVAIPAVTSPTPSAAPPHHIHTASIAQSEASSASASIADMDYGLPRVMSPPSMYDRSTGLHAHQLSISSVISSESPTKFTEKRTMSSSSLSSVTSTASGEPTAAERHDPRMSMASTISDGEVGIGLSLLSSLGGGDSDDEFEDAPGGRSRQDTSVGNLTDSGSSVSSGRRALSPSPIPEHTVAAFPRPPSSQFAVATTSDPVNPFGTFGQHTPPGARGKLDSISESFGKDGHDTMASSESLVSDPVETSSSESEDATAIGHSTQTSQVSEAIQSIHPQSPTAISARSESVYSSSQPSSSIRSASPDPSPFPPLNFKFPAQRPDSTAASSDAPPLHSPTLSHTSGASASEWDGASDIYDNYLYRYSMASKNSRLSQMSMASRSGLNHRNIPSTSTMPPAAVAAMTGPLNSPTSSNFRPSSVHTGDNPTSSEVTPTESQAKFSDMEGSLYSSLPSTDTDATVTPSRIPPRYDSLTMQRSSGALASLRSFGSRRSVGSPPLSEDESDDESIYSRLSSKPSLSLLEAHAASLLAPENKDRVNTTSALNVVKNSPSPNTSSFEENVIAGKNVTRRPSPLDLTKDKTRSSAITSTNGFVGPSPLLHTRWGSPESSNGQSTGSTYDDRYSAGYPTPPLTDIRGSDEGKNQSNTVAQQRNSHTTETEEDASGPDSSLLTITRPLVIDDDEELPSHAIDPEEEEVNVSLSTMESADSQFLNDARTSVHSSFPSPKSKNESPGVSPLLITSSALPPSLQVTSDSPRTPPSGSSPVSAISRYSPGDPPMELLPTASTLLPPPSPTSAQPIPGPSLAEFRGYADSAVKGQRQSLFLPHPNAPKAPPQSSGPMYLRNVGNPPEPEPDQIRQGPDPKKVASHVLRMILNSPPPQLPSVMLPPPSSMPIRGTTKRGAPPAPPAPLPRGPTIYARVDVDLSSSHGPVPITFSPEPMGPPPLPPIYVQDNINTMSSSVRAPPSPRQPLPPAVPGSQNQRSESPQINTIKRSVTTPASLSTPSSAPSPAPPSGFGSVVPRDKFTPQGPTARPRSKSFSAGIASFAKGNAPVPNPPTLRPRGSSSSLSSSPLVPPLSSTNSPSNPSPLRPSSLSRPASNSKLRNGVSASSLFHPSNNTSGTALSTGGGSKAPSSPLASSFGPMANGRPSQLRKVTSMASLSNTPSSLPGPSSLSRASTDGGSHEPQRTSSSIATTSISRRSNDQPPSGKDSDVVSIVSSTSQATSPTLVGRQSSLRSKLSLPNLHRGHISREGSISSAIATAENETLQVQDMDFELVRPKFPIATSRSSEESSSGLRRRSESRAPEPGQLLRSESPAGSISSGISGTSRITAGILSDSAAFRSRVSSKASDSEASMDAHRQREQKWMTIMSTVPAAQACKNKKVRKLLGEGVPSSVRYLVWAHLTNAKSKGVAGVYSQLSKRVRVAAFADMQRDVKNCFGEHQHLQSTEGPLINLLQAYLTMLPDVQYSTGLTLIAGHTLLLAPEEDAFWIFVSMMDSALRPYFSPNSTQMEVDAALFSRVLEVNDAQVSKKLLVDMGINPAHICFPWFTTLFVGSLPGDYVNRVWDLFLYEGVPILIRVGLAIVYCCRRAILEATSEDAVLYYLKRPSATWLPPSPDAFQMLASSFKVKDDDIRKQRVKMEKQVKKQAQGQGTRLVANGGISLPRSV